MFSLHGYYSPSSSFIRNFKLLAIFCDCTARFGSDLVGTQIVGFLMHRLFFFFFQKIITDESETKNVEEPAVESDDLVVAAHKIKTHSHCSSMYDPRLLCENKGADQLCSKCHYKM